MCGIAGVLFKNSDLNAKLGETLIEMLDGCQHRGPDSTGFALYGGEAETSEFVLRFYVGEGDEGA
jgi:glutamate synthase domain-containing protein 1